MKVTFFPPGQPSLILCESYNPIPHISKGDGYYSLYLESGACGPAGGYEAARYHTREAALEDYGRILDCEAEEANREGIYIAIHIGGDCRE